jgi:hypothetical protein
VPVRRRPAARLTAATLGAVSGRLPALLTALAAVLVVRAAWPTPAHAVDLFPVDDWLGDGLKEAGDVVLGPLEFGAKEIAKLLATLVGALADLLIPKSLVNAGIDGIRWLVSMPAVGAAAVPAGGDGGYALQVRMPHVLELRQTLTWVGVTLLPLGLVIAGGMAVLNPTANSAGPTEILIRVCTAGLALIAYDWIWAVLTRLCRLLTGTLLGLPWVDDGVEKMLETLLIGGAAGTAVAAEFVIPLLIMFAGGALLALLLLRVGLEVATALLYVLGGLVLGLSPTEFGRRLLTGWLVATVAIVVLPVLWTVVFVCGAALMLDAGSGPGGGFGRFIAQLFNIAAAAAVFVIAIKLGLGVFARAQSSIASLGSTQLSSISSLPRAGGSGAAAAPTGVPASLAGFSRGLRARAAGGARVAGAAAVLPIRHPVNTAQGVGRFARDPVQSTQQAAGELRDHLRAPAAARTGPLARTATPAAAANATPPANATLPTTVTAGQPIAGTGAGSTRAPQAVPGSASGAAARRLTGASRPSGADLSPPLPRPEHSQHRQATDRQAPMPRPRPSTSAGSGPVASVAIAAGRAAAPPSRAARSTSRPGPTLASGSGPRPVTAPPPSRRRKPRPTPPKTKGSS